MITKELERVASLHGPTLHEEAKAVRGVATASQVRNEYVAQLQRLQARYGTATSDEEGKGEFREDVNLIDRALQTVLAAGMAGCAHIESYGTRGAGPSSPERPGRTRAASRRGAGS